MAGPLADALAQTRDAERRRAARALLLRPLLRADGPDGDAFVLVLRHSAHLRRWFHDHAGWRLTVTPELARLVKTTDPADPGAHTHPAITRRPSAPFTRRRYVLACLALAVLSRADAQVTLGRLADDVLLAASDPELAAAGLAFALDRQDQRADLVAAVRLLIDQGVLARVAGDEDLFLDDAGDVLYDVQRRVLAAVLASPRGPSTIFAAGHDERLAQLTASDGDGGAERQREERMRRRLTRRLLDEPVVYYDALTAPERELLASRRAAITGAITALTGLVAEARAEGIAMVDPGGGLTDVRMPEGGTDGHATLLLATRLAASAGEDERGENGTGENEAGEHEAGEHDVAGLEEWIREQARAFTARGHWRRSAADPGAERHIVRAALDRLEALGLVRRDGDTVTPLPAIARYAVAEPTVATLTGEDTAP